MRKPQVVHVPVEPETGKLIVQISLASRCARTGSDTVKQAATQVIGTQSDILVAIHEKQRMTISTMLTQTKAICLLSVLLLGACASGPPSYELNIRSANTGGNDLFILYPEEGVVLLTGSVEDRYIKNAVIRAATQKGKKVVDRIRIRS